MKQFFVLTVVVLAFSFAAGSAIFASNLEPQDDDQDIYIREYDNASCGFFAVWFGQEYSVNETTKCKCERKNVTRCTTTIVHPTTTTVGPTSSGETTTSAKPSEATTTEAPTTKKAFENVQEEMQDELLDEIPVDGDANLTDEQDQIDGDDGY